MGKKSKKNSSASSGGAAAAPKFDEQALNKLTKSIETTINSKSPKTAEKNSNGPREGKAPKQGKKRDSQGNVKDRSESNSADDRETLLQEILALGGTEEDLDLIAGAVSDDEDLGGAAPATSNKDLKKELAKFVAGLGIEGHVEEESAGEEEDQDGHWEDSDDEVESEEAIDEPVATPPAKESAKAESAKNIGKDGSRLVSKASNMF